MTTVISCIIESGSFHIHSTTWGRNDRADAQTEYLASFDHITGDNSSSAALADAEAIRQQWAKEINPNPRNAGRKPMDPAAKKQVVGWAISPAIIQAVKDRAAQDGRSVASTVETLLTVALAK